VQNNSGGVLFTCQLVSTFPIVLNALSFGFLLPKRQVLPDKCIVEYDTFL